MVVEWDLVCEAEGWHATIGAAQGSKAITLFQENVIEKLVKDKQINCKFLWFIK